MPRGRKPQPPRTDPDEIQRNREKTLTEFHERTVDSYPPDHYGRIWPSDPIERAAAMMAEADEIASLGLPPVTATKIEAGDLPKGHPLAVGLGDAAPAEPPPPAPPPAPSGPWVELNDRLRQLQAKIDRLPDGHPSREALTAEQIEILSSDVTSPTAMMAKAWPRRPAWVEEAFIASVAVVKAMFGPAPRGAPLPCRLLTPSAAALMLEPTAAGITALHTHATRLEGLFCAFVTKGPPPEEYTNLFLRVVIPTYNAVSLDSRRCVDCGRVFALRTPKERAESRRCDDCSARFHSRESQRKRRAAPDAETRTRSRERGDAAIAAAERRQAKGAHWRQAEALDRLIDEQKKDKKSTMTVKGTKKNVINSDSYRILAHPPSISMTARVLPRSSLLSSQTLKLRRWRAITAYVLPAAPSPGPRALR